MSDPNATITRRAVTAREHLAGVKAAQAYHQALAAAHLLDSQSPVKDTPYPAESKP